jgi:hypothetical protein
VQRSSLASADGVSPCRLLSLSDRTRTSQSA